MYYPNRKCEAPYGRTTCIGAEEGCMQMLCTQCGERRCLRYWAWSSQEWFLRSSLFLQDGKARQIPDGQLLNVFEQFPHVTIGLWWSYGWEAAVKGLTNLKEDIDEMARRKKPSYDIIVIEDEDN